MFAQPITGAILAGGQHAGDSFRLFQGEPLIDRQIRIMRDLCREIIVVTDDPKPFLLALDSSVRLITDYYPACGPLGGMHAALHLARHPQVWIAGSDMPYLSSEAARRLASYRTVEVRSAVPIIGGSPVPLHGVYDKSCAEPAAKLLSEGVTSLEAFLGRIRWQGVPADDWTGEADIGDFTRTCGPDAAEIRHGMSTTAG